MIINGFVTITLALHVAATEWMLLHVAATAVEGLARPKGTTVGSRLSPKRRGTKVGTPPLVGHTTQRV